MDNYQAAAQGQSYTNQAKNTILQNRTLDQLSSIAANIKSLNSRLTTLLYRFGQEAPEDVPGMLGTMRSDNYLLTLEEIHRQVRNLEDNIAALEGHA